MRIGLESHGGHASEHPYGPVKYPLSGSRSQSTRSLTAHAPGPIAEVVVAYREDCRIGTLPVRCQRARRRAQPSSPSPSRPKTAAGTRPYSDSSMRWCRMPYISPMLPSAKDSSRRSCSRRSSRRCLRSPAHSSGCRRSQRVLTRPRSGDHAALAGAPNGVPLVGGTGRCAQWCTPGARHWPVRPMVYPLRAAGAAIYM
jgi:hypothetical protein